MSPYWVSRALEFIDPWLDFHSRNDTIPGFAVTIQHGSEVVFSKAYGVADQAAQTPLTTAHLFNTGSQAKMYTAVAVMQLAESGRLSLEDRAATYVPWLAQHADPAYARITIRQLLWHSAGLIRDGNQADYWQFLAPFPDGRGLQELVLGSSLVFQPGSRFKYSDLGYALLGEVIAKASGCSYAQYVQHNIFDVLGLGDTFVDLSPAVLQRITPCYTQPIDGMRLAVPPAQALNFAPVAGLYMTTRDACGFLAAFFDKDTRLLGRKAKQQLLRRRPRRKPEADVTTDYAFGFMRAAARGRTLVGHSGGFTGYRSAAFADTEQSLAVSVATNAKDGPVLSMCFGIFDTLFYFAEHAKIPADQLHASFGARLRNLWSAVDIVTTHKRIVAVYPDEWFPFAGKPQTLVPVDASTLKIEHAPDLMSPGELVHYAWKSRRVTSVNYAGSTLVPEQDFAQWLHQKYESTGIRPSVRPTQSAT